MELKLHEEKIIISKYIYIVCVCVGVSGCVGQFKAVQGGDGEK